MTLAEMTLIASGIVLLLLVAAWYEMYRHRDEIADTFGVTAAEVSGSLAVVAMGGAAILALVML